MVRRFVAAGHAVDVITSDAHDLWYFTNPKWRRVDAPGEAIVDFLALLRGVDMDRRADELRSREGDDLGELPRRHRAKAMRCHTDRLLPVPR